MPATAAITPVTTEPRPPAVTDTAGAATYLGVSESQLNAWRAAGEGPRFVRMGRLVRYRFTDLDRYLAANVVGGAA